MFDTKKTKKEKLTVVFDIRNSSVGVAIFEETKNIPEIIYTNRKYIFHKERQKSDNFIEKTYSTIQELALDIKKNAPGRIDKVNCIFSSPWYQTKLKTLVFKENKSTIFTENYLHKKMSGKADERIDEEVEILEDKILSTYLNGYEISSPYGKKFTQAKFALFRTLISKSTKLKISEIIQNTLKTDNINLNSHTLAILSILKTNYHSVKDFCLFDIGGEITEVSIFDDGLFKEVINIPKGYNFLIRKISEKYKVDKQSAISKIKLISSGELTDKKLDDFILTLTKEWFREIKEIRKEELENVSKNIFIATDNDYKKILADNFNHKDFYTDILELPIQPNTRIIDSISTNKLVTYSENTQRDPILSILCNFSTIVF